MVLVYLHGNCASCMVNALQLFAVIIGFIPFISIAVCHLFLPFNVLLSTIARGSNSVSTYPIPSTTFAMT